MNEWAETVFWLALLGMLMTLMVAAMRKFAKWGRAMDKEVVKMKAQTDIMDKEIARIQAMHRKREFWKGDTQKRGKQ